MKSKELVEAEEKLSKNLPLNPTEIYLLVCEGWDLNLNPEDWDDMRR